MKIKLGKQKWTKKESQLNQGFQDEFKIVNSLTFISMDMSIDVEGHKCI